MVPAEWGTVGGVYGPDGMPIRKTGDPMAVVSHKEGRVCQIRKGTSTNPSQPDCCLGVHDMNVQRKKTA